MHQTWTLQEDKSSAIGKKKLGSPTSPRLEQGLGSIKHKPQATENLASNPGHRREHPNL